MHDLVLDECRLDSAEQAIADSVPFGDATRISASVANTYLTLLAAIAEDVPGAGLLLKVLNDGDRGTHAKQTVLRDALIRRTIEDGYCLQIHHRDCITFRELDDLLTEAALLAARDESHLLINSARCSRLPTVSPGSWIWTDASPKSGPARRFVDQCLSRVPAQSLDCPGDQHFQNLLEGVEAAHELVPEMTRSALSHTFMIGVVNPVETIPFNAMTALGLPGIVFLTPAVLGTRLRAAEALLHESLHLKFIDIDYLENLFAPGFRPGASPRFTPPWHNGSAKGGWPVDRLLTAMHVYLALAVFFGRVDQRLHQEWSDDGMSPLDRAFQALDRARYLVDQAKESHEYLSANGSRFVAWIERTLEDLDPRYR